MSPLQLSEKIQIHAYDIKTLALLNDRVSLDVIRMYQLLVDQPDDPVAQSLCEKAVDSWIRRHAN